MSAKLENGTVPGETMSAGVPADLHETLEQLKPFRNIPLNVEVELGATGCALRDLLALQYHSVVVLDQQAGAKLRVYVNGVLIGNAEPQVADDRVGVKIDEILDARE